MVMKVIKILTLKYWENKFFSNKYTEVKTIQKIIYFIRLISKSGKVLGKVYFNIEQSKQGCNLNMRAFTQRIQSIGYIEMFTHDPGQV